MHPPNMPMMQYPPPPYVNQSSVTSKPETSQENFGSKIEGNIKKLNSLKDKLKTQLCVNQEFEDQSKNTLGG
jgi:hypothetical protein